MGKVVKLHEGSLALRIILELYFGIVLPRVMLTGSESLDYNNRYVRSVFSWLKEKGYIGYINFANRRYCYLTKEGVSVLRKTDDRFAVNSSNYRNHRFYAKDIRETARDGEVFLALERFGVHAFPHLRIAFEDLLSQKLPRGEKIYRHLEAWSLTRNGTEKEFDYEQMMKEGIYFPSKEIRHAASQLNLLDVFKMSRFSGVLIRGETIYICYNTMERLMRCVSNCEYMTRKGVYNLLRRFGTSEEGSLRVNEYEIEILLFGHSIGKNLKKLIWGNIKNAPWMESRGKREYLSCKNLYVNNISQFCSIHYVSLENNRMIKELTRIMEHADMQEVLLSREEKFFHEMGRENWFWLGEWDRAGTCRGEDGSKMNIYRLPDLELKRIEFLLEQEKEYVLITFQDYVGSLMEVLNKQYLREIYVYENEEMAHVKRYYPEKSTREV